LIFLPFDGLGWIGSKKMAIFETQSATYWCLLFGENNIHWQRVLLLAA